MKCQVHNYRRNNFRVLQMLGTLPFHYMNFVRNCRPFRNSGTLTNFPLQKLSHFLGRSLIQELCSKCWNLVCFHCRNPFTDWWTWGMVPAQTPSTQQTTDFPLQEPLRNLRLVSTAGAFRTICGTQERWVSFDCRNCFKNSGDWGVLPLHIFVSGTLGMLHFTFLWLFYQKINI